MIARRAFVKTGLASLVACRFANFANKAPGSEPGSIPLSFSLYGMRDIPVSRAIESLASMGYKSVEFAALEGFATDPKKCSRTLRTEIRKTLNDQKISLVSVMESFPHSTDAHFLARYPDRIKKAAELFRDCSPNGEPLLETILGGKPGGYAKDRDGLVAMLRSWEKPLESAEAKLAIKAHRFQMVNTHAILADLLKAVDSPRIVAVFDPSHEPDPTTDCSPALEAIRGRLAFIHIKDVDWHTSPQKDAKFALPGRGKLNWPAFVRALWSSPFRGPVCVEVSRQIWEAPGYDPLAGARESIAFLQKTLG